VTSKDELLRRRQAEAEAACDRCGERDSGRSERREWIDWCTDHGVNVDNATAAQKHSYRVERGWEFDQLAAWNLQQMESDFSARMLHDGLDQQTIMSLLLSMRHHNDPLYVGFSEGEIAEVSATVDMERARITGLLDQFREDDE